MGKIDDIKQAAEQLSIEELADLRAWLEELEENRFDEQIERDAKAGKLDKLEASARENLRAGRVRDL